MRANVNLGLRKLSPFQRTFVKLLLRTDSVSEAKKGAEDISQSLNWTMFEGQPGNVSEVLERYGLSLRHLLEDYLLPMLDATKTLAFSHKGIVRDRWVVPYSDLQFRALELALELHGAFSDEVVEFSQESEFQDEERSTAIH